jgi:hypothetical protein
MVKQFSEWTCHACPPRLLPDGLENSWAYHYVRSYPSMASKVWYKNRPIAHLCALFEKHFVTYTAGDSREIHPSRDTSVAFTVFVRQVGRVVV